MKNTKYFQKNQIFFYTVPLKRLFKKFFILFEYFNTPLIVLEILIEVLILEKHKKLISFRRIGIFISLTYYICTYKKNKYVLF